MKQLLVTANMWLSSKVLLLIKCVSIIFISVATLFGGQDLAHAQCVGWWCGFHWEKLEPDTCTMDTIPEVDDSCMIPPSYMPNSTSPRTITYKIKDIVITIPATAAKDFKWAKVPPKGLHAQPVKRFNRAARTGRNPQTGATIKVAH